MNEVPVIGTLRLRTGLWDRQGANILTRYKGTYGERFFVSFQLYLYMYGLFLYLLTYMKIYFLKGEKSLSAEMEIIFTELMLTERIK